MSTISYPINWVVGQRLDSADLNAQFAAVNTITGITAGQLAADAVTTTTITNNSVTTEKLAVRATYHGTLTKEVTAGLLISTTETTVAEFATLPSRGGFIMIFGTIAGTYGSIDNATHAVNFLLYRTDLSGPTTTLAAAWRVQAVLTSIGDAFPMPFTVSWQEVPAAGNYVYKVNIVTSSANATYGTNAAAPGSLFVTEFA